VKIKTNTILQGDVREVLKTLPSNSVDCIVTSPPYWGLRDYGRKKQLGMEKTPELFIANLQAIGKELFRVLKPTGTLWLNLSDSYYGSGKAFGQKTPLNKLQVGNKGSLGNVSKKPASLLPHPNLKKKDLAGIPHKTAFALQEIGYYLRSDIVWEKPNPMPESITDRPTKSKEYIFMLTKSPQYFFNQDAVREPLKQASLDRARYGWDGNKTEYSNGMKKMTAKEFSRMTPENGRNIRDVWEFPAKGYKGAHFATFPPELPRRCILAGCPKGGVVLDPFAGSGTTLMVANQLGMKYIGIELNPKYIKLADKRIKEGK
jgi:DNA modification methylase